MRVGMNGWGGERKRLLKHNRDAWSCCEIQQCHRHWVVTVVRRVLHLPKERSATHFLALPFAHNTPKGCESVPSRPNIRRFAFLRLAVLFPILLIRIMTYAFKNAQSRDRYEPIQLRNQTSPPTSPIDTTIRTAQVLSSA